MLTLLRCIPYSPPRPDHRQTHLLPGKKTKSTNLNAYIHTQKNLGLGFEFGFG